MIKFITLTIALSLFVALDSATAQVKQEVIKVEVKQIDGEWKMFRGGEPYYIKGVGGHVYLDQAKAYGANSLRTWGVEDAANVLDKAHEMGLTVVFGLWMGVERQGFNYNDTRAVEAQLAGFAEVVEAYKNHPALLMWGIGNEVDLFYSDYKVWDAVDDVAEMIKNKDSNHPTMTVTAGFDVAEVQLIKERAPHIDIYGINTYGELIGIDKQVRAFGWEGPYIIAEWGPNGHWEVAKTAWNTPIEQTSSEKAESYKERYQKGILDDKEQCLGSYVFLWGQKQETTPTWYGVFLEDGTETEVMDVLQKGWSGKEPENKSPHIASMKLDGKTVYESVAVKPNNIYSFAADITDPDGDQLRFVYEILPESTDIKSGGDRESKPESIKMEIVSGENTGSISFKAPSKNGPYRLFVYAYDGHGNAATGNFPFYVGRYQVD